MKSPLGLTPPAWLFFSILGMIVVRVVAPAGVLAPEPWNLLGVVPVIVGTAVAIVAERQFKHHGTTVEPFEPSSALITDGVFAFSRHPMYLGMVVLLVGVGVCLGSVGPLALSILFFMMMEFAFVRREERMMLAQFGDGYREYRRRVRRWI